MPPYSSGVKLCWRHDCSDCRRADTFRDGAVAVEQWMAAMVQDPLVLISLRQAAWDCGHDGLSQLDNSSLIKTLAQEVSSGRLRICDENWTTPQFVAPSSSLAGGSESSAVSKPFPRATRVPQTLAAAPVETEQPTLSTGLNVPAQSFALASAAAQGVPFCPE